MDDEPLAGNEQYFSERPRSRSARSELRFLYRGELLAFTVDRGVFASHGLDPGTALLIENLSIRSTDTVLDVGCGWGPVGVAAAKAARDGRVVLTEVNRRAARLARANLERNRVANGEVRIGAFFEPVPHERFDIIATNPPYRAGRPHVLRLLAEAPNYLKEGGRLVMVGKGSQGIRYYQQWLVENWSGSVAVLGRGSGYRVLEARRPPIATGDPGKDPPTRSSPPAGTPKRRPGPRYAITVTG